ncbi:MAG: ABC transporter permease [Oscillospiraceae bacterium]|jgi:spermidine/putrescine transport system permease protein|nr:ABC transporter permease [Oscillospiraceae bacterium]
MSRLKILSFPYIAWVLLFTVAPMLIILFFAMTTKDNTFTIMNISYIGRYFSVTIKSILMAAVITFATLVIAYPFAYILSRMKPQTGHLILVISVLPMWINFLLRAYAWLTILENTGLLNRILLQLGLGRINIINTKIAVAIGMIYNYLPVMLLQLFSTMTKINNGAIEAAQDLGAGTFAVLRHVVLPLSMPGVITGANMVFVPAVSTFIISRMLGGGSNMLIGDLIDMQFLGNTYNPHVGAAISLVLMVLTLLCMSIMNQSVSEELDGKLT